MNALFSRFSLPLLTKELTEQSSRGRTFILRTVYALALYGVGLGSFVNQSGGWDNLSFNILGTGGRLFSAVVQYQLAAIYLLLPMITAGTITSEKERDTLGILLITKLGPWTIVLEKFLSRVVPMLLYILMALPLLAVAYSLGGVENGQVLQAGVILVLCVLQVGSLAVLCSVWFRTTPQAVICTYLLLGLMHFLAMIFERAVQGFPPQFATENERVLVQSVIALVSPSRFLMTREPLDPSNLAATAGLAVLPVFFYLFAARLALWPRAFLQARSWGLTILKFLDRFFHVINQNAVTRGVVLIRDHVPLPTSRPLAWRELNKRSLGTTRYLIRFLLITEAPLIALLLLPLAMGDVYTRGTYAAGEWAMSAVWMLAVFMLLVQSSALITGERARQTLDVLLSTPMMTRDLVMQKMAGVHYLIKILYVPMATAAVFWVFWLSAGQHRLHPGDQIWHVVRMVVQPLIYLPLVAWGGFYCGLKCKSQTQAMLLGTVIIGILVGLPQILLPMFHSPMQNMNQFGNGFVYNQGLMRTVAEQPIIMCVIQLLFPCSSYLETLMRPRVEQSFRVDPSFSQVRTLIEIVHWLLYFMILMRLRDYAPRALARSTQRAEAPLEEMALEPA